MLFKYGFIFLVDDKKEFKLPMSDTIKIVICLFSRKKNFS